MVTQAELQAAIHEKVGAVSTLFVSDVSGGCGQAYEVVIVSDQFEGMPMLKRHRLVNDRLKHEIAAMHAFSQKTYTTRQFEELRAKYAAPAPDVSVPPSPQSTPPRRPAGSRSPAPASIHVPAERDPRAVPELTLTPVTASSGVFKGPDAHESWSPVDTESAAPSFELRSVSRLYHETISSPRFWVALRDTLPRELMHAPTPVLDDASATQSPRSRRPRGEPEAELLFEDFLLSQKQYLSASDVARIRDETGMLGMAG